MEVARGHEEVAGAHAWLAGWLPAGKLPQPFSLLGFPISLRPLLRHHLWETVSKVPVWSCALGVPTASRMGAPPGTGPLCVEV